MQRLLIVLSLIAVAGFGYVLVSGSSSQDESPGLTFAEIEQNIDEGAKFIDVRTPQEFDAGHIEGASLFPLQTMETGSLPDLDKQSKVYVYCRSGNRSAQAKNILDNAGFTDVIDLGGIADVERIGGMVVN